MRLSNKLKHSKYFILLLLNFFLIFSLLSTSISPSQLKFSLFADDELNLDLSLLPRANLTQNLEEWYNPKIEMLIITSPDKPNFSEILKPLSDWKNQKGIKTLILSNYSKYPGIDDAEKIRNMIKEYYESENIQWVLLAGDTDVLPIRYVYNDDTLKITPPQHEVVGNDTYKPTDFYYADLDGNWDDDGDGKWGESSINNQQGIDEIEWTPEVYVGRLPASNDEDLEIMVNKTLKYETDPKIGDWMNSFLLAGVISDYPYQTESGIGEDEARLTDYILSNYVPNTMDYVHLIETTSTYDPPNPPFSNISNQIFNNNFNDGHSIGMFAGHAAPDIFASRSKQTIYTNTNARNSANNNMPTLFYADACTTASFDVGDYSIGEELIKRENAGAIGYVGSLRINYYHEEDTNLEMLNRGNCKLFWREFFFNKNYQPGKTLYDSKVAYLKSDWFKYSNINMTIEWERKNVLTYSLLGDPEVDIYTNIPKSPKNPFTGDIYEGQSFLIYITDINDNVLSNSRINLVSVDGKYRTFYADENGLVSFSLPLGVDTYNFTITGHNIKPINGSFTTLADTIPPEVSSGPVMVPPIPTVSDNICFTINMTDEGSGLENTFLLISSDNFSSFNFTLFEKESNTDNLLSCTLNKLDIMAYQYAIVGFDYANNSIILYDINDFYFEINPPVLSYILISINIGLIVILGLGMLLFVKNWLNYQKKFLRSEGI